MGSISLRIPSLAIAYDGPVKLAHGAGVAFCGSGHLLYGNGDAYIGEFSNGQRHGWGQVLRADGSKFQCHWSNDAPAADADANLRAGEEQRAAQLDRSLCDWVSAILATASISPLSPEDMRARIESSDVIIPPPAPPAIADAALTSSRSARAAEVQLIQRMSSELASLRKNASDSQSLSHSIELQRTEIASATMQLQHAHAMHGALQASLATTDQRLQAALASLAEAQARERRLIQEASAAAAESSAFQSQLIHSQNLLGAAQDTVAAQKSQVRGVGGGAGGGRGCEGWEGVRGVGGGVVSPGCSVSRFFIADGRAAAGARRRASAVRHALPSLSFCNTLAGTSS